MTTILRPALACLHEIQHRGNRPQRRLGVVRMKVTPSSRITGLMRHRKGGTVAIACAATVSGSAHREADRDRRKGAVHEVCARQLCVNTLRLAVEADGERQPFRPGGVDILRTHHRIGRESVCNDPARTPRPHGQDVRIVCIQYGGAVRRQCGDELALLGRNGLDTAKCTDVIGPDVGDHADAGLQEVEWSLQGNSLAAYRRGDFQDAEFVAWLDAKNRARRCEAGLLWLPGFLFPLNWLERTAAMSSLVVDLPQLPVTPMKTTRRSCAR